MKNLKLFAALFTALVAVSCAKEAAPEIIIDDHAETVSRIKEMTFLAFTDDGLATRTSLDGLAVKWGASEGIYLFDGYAPRAFTSTNTEESTSVNFTGFAATSNKYYAVYPSGTFDASTSTITTSIPTFQTATVSSFAPKSNVAVAYAETTPTEENVLQFKNVGAVVKFRVANTGITKVRLESVNGEPLSGKVNVSFGMNDAINATMSTTEGDTQSCVIMNAPAGLATDKDYYFVIAPGDYTGGFKITLFKGNNYKSRTSSSSESLESNDLMDFGTIPSVADGKWNEPTPIDVTVFEETFSGFNGTGGRDDAFSGSIATNSKDNPDNQGWTWSGCGGADQCVKIGTSSNQSATTPSIELIGDATLTFNVAGWATGENSFSVSATGADLQGTTSVQMTNGQWKSHSIQIHDADGNVKITFSGKRGFLDDVKIVQQQISGSSGPADPEIEEASTEIKNKTTGFVAAASGSTASFDVDSNVPWTLAANQSFVSLSVDSENKITVTFEELPINVTSRDVTITVTPDSGEAQDVTFTQKGATDVTLNFSEISGFSSWGSTYTNHTVDYGDYTVNFASANKQSSTITDIPVTKGQPVELKMKESMGTISSVTFTCKQWGTKAQTITLHYSLDGGTNYTTTGVTSTNFSISNTDLPTGTNAVKITFSTTDNQVGIERVTFTYQ